MDSALKGNAHRLAGVLERYADDRPTVEQIAQLLNYVPNELQRDMRALLEWITMLESEE